MSEQNKELIIKYSLPKVICDTINGRIIYDSERRLIIKSGWFGSTVKLESLGETSYICSTNKSYLEKIKTELTKYKFNKNIELVLIAK